MPVFKTCVVCGKEFSVPPCRAETATTCSNVCAVSVRAKSRERKELCKCSNCGKEFTSPRSQAGRRKYCSLDCKHSSKEFSNLISSKSIGENNSNWAGGVVDSGGGYLALRLPDHPFSSNGYVLEHRYVMEQWLKECFIDSPFLVDVSGEKYLAPGFDVHHLDENKKNNTRNNLLVCTKQTHVLLHSGYGVNSKTFWPELDSILIDESPPSVLMKIRRNAKRKERQELVNYLLAKHFKEQQND